jgi:hypothetical protein
MMPSLDENQERSERQVTKEHLSQYNPRFWLSFDEFRAFVTKYLISFIVICIIIIIIIITIKRDSSFKLRRRADGWMITL